VPGATTVRGHGAPRLGFAIAVQAATQQHSRSQERRPRTSSTAVTNEMLRSRDAHTHSGKRVREQTRREGGERHRAATTGISPSGEARRMAGSGRAGHFHRTPRSHQSIRVAAGPLSPRAAAHTWSKSLTNRGWRAKPRHKRRRDRDSYRDRESSLRVGTVGVLGRVVLSTVNGLSAIGGGHTVADGQFRIHPFW
jgi:hypothetical protein